MTVVDILLERNAQDAGPRHRETPPLPALGALIITCPDPRVDPVHIFDLKPGEAAVIRAAGGRMAPMVLQNLLFLSMVGATYGQAPGKAEIILLQHTDCGMNRLTGPDHREALAGFLGTTVDDIETDPVAAVRRDVETLAAHPLVPDSVNVTAAVYDVRTGRVDLVERRAPLRTGG